MNILEKKIINARWNLSKIQFLYPPDNFPGSFSNEIMQMKHEAKKEAKISTLLTDIEASDGPMAAMNVLNRLDHIQFILNNIEAFTADNCLEKAILKLYTRENSSFESGGLYDIWHELFSHCNREQFYSLGSPFPEEPVLAFRGSVTGLAKGFCWTVNQQKIDWFTERWRDKSLGGGTIFSTHICRQDVLIYLNDKEQEEIIISPQFLETAEIREI
ncbi:MAG: hypothetical protein JRJ68_03800 [Deltaproteobacteria bacterium]|nr:hypothetical protein [Deltaproteobacteria bacterium]